MSNDWQTLYESERDTVSRCWKALGIATYEQAGGKAIWEIIAEQKSALVELLDRIGMDHMGYWVVAGPVEEAAGALDRCRAALARATACDHSFEQIDGQWGCTKCGSEMT